MSLSELADHKSLKLDNIYDVKEGFYLIEDHDAQLIGYAAIAVIFHYQQEGLHKLASDSGAHILWEFNIVVGGLWNFIAHDYVLSRG